MSQHVQRKYIAGSTELKKPPTGVSDHLLVVVFLIPRCECRDPPSDIYSPNYRHPPSDIYSPNLLCIVPLLWNAQNLKAAAAGHVLYCGYYSSLSLLFRLVQ